MPTVDGASIQTFDPLPTGTYNARLSVWENKKSNDGDSDNVNCQFTIEDGEYQGRKVFLTRNLKPQALWAFKKMCRALGSEEDEFVGIFDTDEILRKVQGNECRLKLSLQQGGEYDGRQKVDDVLAPTLAI